MNKNAIAFFSVQNSEYLTNLEKIPNDLTQNKFYGQIDEREIKQFPEIKSIKVETEPEYVKILKKSTQEEVVEQFYESINQSEIIIKEESPQIDHITTVLKTETEPEIKTSHQKVNTKKYGLTNLRKSLKKLYEKPIQNKPIVKDDIFKVSKKKCPFCGKKHEDLTVTFCHACGYKF